MEFLKSNLPWIAPSVVIAASTVALISSGVLDRDPAPEPANFTAAATASAPAQPAYTAPAAQPLAPSAADIAAAQQADERKRWDKLNSLVQAASGTQPTAAPQQQAQTAPVEEVVTRSEPLAVLETAPAQVIQPVDTAKVANFFDNAQANIAANDFCADDLRALAASTRIYFPAGGLTAEASGLIKARLIGKIAHDCPGYAVRVEGHSDPSGNPQVNLKLSQQRAEAVIARLASGGIDTSLFIPVGMGDKTPSNIEGPKGSAYYDRRVEFSIVETEKTASVASFTPTWSAGPASECVDRLQAKVAQTRLFYSPRAITVAPSELQAVYELARDTQQCEGARLRIVGQHTDQIGARETVSTGRFRALALMGSLVSAGYDDTKILVGAPSYSVGIPGQPGLPNSRVDFQIITD